MIKTLFLMLAKSEIEKILADMGIPCGEKRSAMAAAYANCVIDFGFANCEEDRKEAIERFFNEFGVTDWRGSAMADAVMDILCGASSADDMASYIIESHERLSELLRALIPFNEENDEEDDFDDEEDEEEDELTPMEQVLISLRKIKIR